VEGKKKVKRYIYLIIFCAVWIASDLYINDFLSQTKNQTIRLLMTRLEAVHWIMFATLGIIARAKRSRFLFVSFLCWAVLDEVIQIPIQSRYGDILDVVRNVAGFLAGYFVLDVGIQVREKLHGRPPSDGLSP